MLVFADFIGGNVRLLMAWSCSSVPPSCYHYLSSCFPGWLWPQIRWGFGHGQCGFIVLQLLDCWRTPWVCTAPAQNHLCDWWEPGGLTRFCTICGVQDSSVRTRVIAWLYTISSELLAWWLVWWYVWGETDPQSFLLFRLLLRTVQKASFTEFTKLIPRLSTRRRGWNMQTCVVHSVTCVYIHPNGASYSCGWNMKNTWMKTCVFNQMCSHPNGPRNYTSQELCKTQFSLNLNNFWRQFI